MQSFYSQITCRIGEPLAELARIVAAAQASDEEPQGGHEFYRWGWGVRVCACLSPGSLCFGARENQSPRATCAATSARKKSGLRSRSPMSANEGQTISRKRIDRSLNHDLSDQDQRYIFSRLYCPFPWSDGMLPVAGAFLSGEWKVKNEECTASRRPGLWAHLRGARRRRCANIRLCGFAQTPPITGPRRLVTFPLRPVAEQMKL